MEITLRIGRALLRIVRSYSPPPRSDHRHTYTDTDIEWPDEATPHPARVVREWQRVGRQMTVDRFLLTKRAPQPKA